MMIKAKELIGRKNTLLTQLAEIEESIARTARELDDKNLNRFLRDGILKSVDGAELKGLKKKQHALLKIGKGLDSQIAIARQREREREVEKIQKGKQDLEKQRGKIDYQVKKKLKQVRELQLQYKGFFDPIMAIEQELKEAQNPQKTDSFKLSEVEQFLKKHYIRYPEKVRQKVRETIEINKAAFSPGTKPLGHDRTQVFGGFTATIQKDSGLCELKGSGWSVDLAFHNPITKAACLGEKVIK